MILLFSGTGNTRRVAELLRNDGEQIVEMNRLPDEPLRIAEGERIVWMFPVYAWGMPGPVMRFINEVTITTGATDDREAGRSADLSPHFMVCTCGDDIGLTHLDWWRSVTRRGWHAVGTFSVTMPNTYVLLPGFDTDPQNVAEEKLRAMPQRVEKIARSIRHEARVDDVVPGAMPWIKSRILRPLFRAFLMSPRPFKSTAACVGCGRCARVCPMKNITMSDIPTSSNPKGSETFAARRPQWGTNCALCLACYHACPYHAVAYGRATRNKGQYSAPSGVKIE